MKNDTTDKPSGHWLENCPHIKRDLEVSVVPLPAGSGTMYLAVETPKYTSNCANSTTSIDMN